LTPVARLTPAAPQPPAVEGVFLIDKPAGMTSHDVVASVRRALGGIKTGHAGTLDPFATGLLLVLTGKATRIQRHVMELPKRYETIARLGALSSTGDIEGEITQTGRLPPDPPPLPLGEIRQRPPIYSAIKVGGERAYRRARRGESFQMPERIVTIHRFEQLWREPGSQQVADAAPQAGGAEAPDSGTARAAFVIECSSGTYVRSLIADLGDGYCEQLRRTAIGEFEVTAAVAPPRRGEPWQAPEPISIEQAMATLPSERLKRKSAQRSDHPELPSSHSGLLGEPGRERGENSDRDPPD
jgi:tRNA pseudouridine55 synthase